MTSDMRQSILRILGTLLLLLCLAGLVAADDLICAKCKKPIETGKWFKIEGRAYHYNHFVCANCGKPIGEQRYIKRDGAFYDSLCFVERFAKRCAYCDGPIMEWVTVGGKDYHDSCFTEHVAERCAICGKPIMGSYLYDPHGAKIHKEHQQSFQQCDYCSRFITAETDGGEKYADGREICGICLKSVVRTRSEADSLLQIARELLQKEGIEIKRKSFDLALTSRDGMNDVSDGHGADKAGFTHLQQSKYLGGLFKDNDIKIYIIDGMPRIHVLATAAHELMHVWLGLNDRFNTEDQLAEGSCNYAAYLVMKHFGDEGEYLIQRMLEDDDPIYGEGFRRVKVYAESVGIYGWLQYLKDYDFPPWTE